MNDEETLERRLFDRAVRNYEHRGRWQRTEGCAIEGIIERHQRKLYMVLRKLPSRTVIAVYAVQCSGDGNIAWQAWKPRRLKDGTVVFVPNKDPRIRFLEYEKWPTVLSIRQMRCWQMPWMRIERQPDTVDLQKKTAWRKGTPGGLYSDYRTQTMQTITHSHSDRDHVKKLAEDDFENLFESFGGRIAHRTSAYCPFHVNRRTPAASVGGGFFHCFSCGVTCDAFEFVMRMRQVDFKTALQILADRYGVALNNRTLTRHQKRAYALRVAAAELEAREVVRWRKRMDAALRELRNVYFKAYHRALRHILKHGLRSRVGCLASDACELYEKRYRTFDRRLARLKCASYDELLPIYRSLAA